MRRLLRSPSEVVALVADEPRWWVGSDELAVLHADHDEAVRWPLRRGPGRRQHAVAVDAVDLLQLGHHARTRRLGTRGGDVLYEQAGRLPPEGGEEVGHAPRLRQPRVRPLER